MFALDREHEGGGALAWRGNEAVWWAVSCGGRIPDRREWGRKRVFRNTSATQRSWYPIEKRDAFCRKIYCTYGWGALCWSFLKFLLPVQIFVFSRIPSETEQHCVIPGSNPCCKKTLPEYLTICYHFCWVVFKLAKEKNQKVLLPGLKVPQCRRSCCVLRKKPISLTSCISPGSAELQWSGTQKRFFGDVAITWDSLLSPSEAVWPPWVFPTLFGSHSSPFLSITPSLGQNRFFKCRVANFLASGVLVGWWRCPSMPQSPVEASVLESLPSVNPAGAWSLGIRN